MKYLVLIPDGMADRKVRELGGRTPMEAADKPMMDELCRKAECGTVLNVPIGMVPESDTANLAIMSYDPKVYSKGRSPLEAMSMGIDLGEGMLRSAAISSRFPKRRSATRIAEFSITARTK